MNRISVTAAARRLALPVVSAAPLTAAVLHQDVSALTIVLSTLGALAGAAAAILQYVLSETLHHAQQVQLQRDQHREAMFREGNQHAEVMLVLDVATSTIDGGDVARAVRGIRGTADPDA